MIYTDQICPFLTNMQCKEVESVRVAVRCRPLSDDEKAGKYESIVAVDQLRGQITVHVPNARTKEERERSFLFDSVFGADAKQTDVYNETSRPIADAVLEGYNGRPAREDRWRGEGGGGGGGVKCVAAARKHT